MASTNAKRILILSTRFPYPLMGGDRIRMYNFCKVLLTQYRVDLLVISEEDVDNAHLEVLTKLGIRVFKFQYPTFRFKLNALLGIISGKPLQVSYYYFTEVQQWIDQHIEKYDVVICNHIRSAEYVRHKAIRKIVDLHDAISLNYSRAGKYASGVWKWIYNIENKRVIYYEKEVINSFDVSLIVSEIDRKFLGERGALLEKIHVVPVAIDGAVIHRAGNLEECEWIVFVGKMNTVANSDAAVYFASMIFPRIKKILKNIEFFIVGADPTPAVLNLRKIEGVQVTGRVENHLEYVEKAMVVVDPMRFGAGMQNKVLEAMALGKPVVATSLATEAISGRDGEHFIVADTADDFARSIQTLFSDPFLRKRLGNNAATLVNQRYTWETIGNSLLSIVNKVCSK